MVVPSLFSGAQGVRETHPGQTESGRIQETVPPGEALHRSMRPAETASTYCRGLAAAPGGTESPKEAGPPIAQRVKLSSPTESRLATPVIKPPHRKQRRPQDPSVDRVTPSPALSCQELRTRAPSRGRPPGPNRDPKTLSGRRDRTEAPAREGLGCLTRQTARS